MHELFTPINANPAATKVAGIINQAMQQAAMGGQQIGPAGSIPAGHGFVGGEGVAHFLDLTGQPEHTLAVEHGGDLLDAQGVVLDGQRGLDAADAIAPAQLRGHCRLLACRQPADLFGDLGDQGEHVRGEGQRWLVGAHAVNSIRVGEDAVCRNGIPAQSAFSKRSLSKSNGSTHSFMPSP